MGQKQSSEPRREVPIEQLSHELALRFASRCYTHLEIAHYKDNFKTLADHQDDLEYWKEDTFGRFLALPELLHATSVLFQMCTYLGAFPFPSLAPCILTREAMLKVITILTGRYKKVLKRGDQDRAKLLFRSLAVFDRRASMPPSVDKPSMDQVVAEQFPESILKEQQAEKGIHAHPTGFTVDEPANDDEEEDEDDLALAALDALDAIEVFKQDQKTDRNIHHAIIPTENLTRLVMLLLLMADIDPLTQLGSYGETLSEERLRAITQSADAIVAAFDPDPHSHGVRYSNFVKTVVTTMPDLFDPLSGLFEHFLFSKNFNLSQHRNAPVPVDVAQPARSPIYRSPEDDSYSIFSDTLLSQLSMSLKLFTPSTALANIFAAGARFNRIYSTSSDGTSLSSFSRQVFSWQSGTLMLISGNPVNEPAQIVTVGAYLPERWPDPASGVKPSAPSHDLAAPKACLLQLQPRQAIFPANPYNHTTPISYFSGKTGIALGCVIPQQSRTHTAPQPPVLGPVSIVTDADMSTATFQHDGDAGSGAFVTDPNLEAAQARHRGTPQQPLKKVTFEIDSLEVWGISFPVVEGEGEGEDEVSKQKKRLAWEEAEAARRRGVNFGGDKDGARALLEMAGLVGDQAGSRSGGSV